MLKPSLSHNTFQTSSLLSMLLLNSFETLAISLLINNFMYSNMYLELKIRQISRTERNGATKEQITLVASLSSFTSIIFVIASLDGGTRAVGVGGEGDIDGGFPELFAVSLLLLVPMINSYWMDEITLKSEKGTTESAEIANCFRSFREVPERKFVLFLESL